MMVVYSENSFNRYAQKTADSFGGLTEGNSISGLKGVSDQYDAYRHALLGAKLTENFGADAARKVGDSYEGYNQNNARDLNMDRWNNDVGITEYQQWANAKENGQTTDTLEKWIYNKVKQGATINDAYNPDDTRQFNAPEIQPTGFWEFNGLLAELLFKKMFDVVLDFFISPAHGSDINPLVNTEFTSAQIWAPPPRRIDPLVMDLDGDGIETIAQSGWNGVLFDHNGDGQKTGTGWLSGDDGFLTLDKNNNGQIDNGNELFGDNSQLSNGGVAADGYAALADIDSNQDGVIDATDTDFANLRVWQDINQDGISQANELKTLTQLGIASLSTAGVASGQTQNGNTITHTGTYTKTDGSTGQTGNLDLASSVFNTEYTETTTLSAGDAARADMHGAGRVRNLRHAAATSDSCRWGKKLITIQQAA